MNALGSSPLTRGKQWQTEDLRDADRLIPAHAGKTRSWVRLSASAGAHPRSRGENEIWPCAMASRKGSSPLTRGKLALDCLNPAAVGLIPAHAGKTLSEPPRPSSGQAHPRSRGENVRRGFAGDIIPGLIPAHAGKTASVA